MSKISADLKRRCVEAMDTMSKPQIYAEIFTPEHEGMSYETFRHKIKSWRRAAQADPSTLLAGTYPEFLATHATVQVDGDGKVVQAWIKQSGDDGAYQKLLDTVRDTTETLNRILVDFIPEDLVEERMLEINLADMHFGLPNDYGDVHSQLINILNAKQYEEINIVLGQDLFHNDDFRGRTSKGTPIEKVDMQTAWNDALLFWASTIRKAASKCHRLKVTYVKGNHDESLSWAFVQLLKGIFPDVEFDDTLVKRKCIYWKNCFIGLTHGDEAKATPTDLRGMFTIEFPIQFAASKVREIHASHLHHEDGKDVYGVMTRRLSTANVTDEWSSNGGFVGAHKRFMVFEYSPAHLKTIYYLDKEGEE